MHPSELSLQLWINTLHCLMRDNMEDFIKNLFSLEAQIYSELTHTKFKEKNINISDLEAYYRKIWRAIGVSSENLQDRFTATIHDNPRARFNGEKQYHKYIAYIQCISDKEQLAYNEIYADGCKKIRGENIINKKRLLHLMKTITISNAMQRFFPLNKKQNTQTLISSTKTKYPMRAGETEDENGYYSIEDDFLQSNVYKGKNQSQKTLAIGKHVESLIKKYREFIRIDTLDEYQIRPILSEIQFLIDRLSGKKRNSCLKCFKKKTKEKKSKIKILKELKNNIDNQESADKKLTGIDVNNLLKQAEKNSVLAKHRHWWGPLFSPTTQTIKTLRRCRHSFYHSQAKHSMKTALAY